MQMFQIDTVHGILIKVHSYTVESNHGPRKVVRRIIQRDRQMTDRQRQRGVRMLQKATREAILMFN